jgi:hypothetical protein
MHTESESLRSSRPIAELSTAGLLADLESHRSKALIFRYDGQDVLPGYHVTEVKAGAFQALDCGANLESWPETFIQLWDIPPEDDRGFMPVGKFLAIMGKVAASVPFDKDAKLTFEVSDGKQAMRLYQASAVEIDGDAVRVALTRRAASCKPRDRWLENQEAQPISCCGASRG